MIDHGLDGYQQDVGMVLKKPASAGFLFSRAGTGGLRDSLALLCIKRH